jgi:Rhodanese-related sulfurtransferase
MINSISVKELIEKKYVNLIDLRNTQKFNDNHIPNSRNILFDKLILEPKKYLNYNDTYYIYCQKGFKSIKACIYLQKLGFTVINIKGGYEAWILEK